MTYPRKATHRTLSDYNNWFQRILTVGSTGVDVELVQQRLNARVTGTYDRETKALVCGLQEKRSLPVTGMVDVVTASRI